MYFGYSWPIIYEISLFVMAANRGGILLATYVSFGVSRAEELEVNQ